MKVGDMLGLPRAKVEPNSGGRKRTMKADQVTVEAVDWLWPTYIPNSMVSLITGDPEAGKGWVTMAIAAAITTGTPLPGGKKREPQRVLFLSAEDSPKHVLVPRLMKQGADLSLISIYPKGFNLTAPAGKEMLKEMIRETEPALIFIDPITGYMGDTDANKNSAVMELYGWLADVASENTCAIVTVRHRRKSADGERKGRDPTMSGMGSVGFNGSARSELLVGLTEDGRRAVAHTKCSVGAKSPSQAFSLNQDNGTLTWDGETDIDGWELIGEMKRKGRGRPAGGEKAGAAAAFLRNFLANAPEPAQVVIGEAEKQGINKHTLVLAKKGLVRAYMPPGDSRWWWTLDVASPVGDGSMKQVCA